MDIHEVIIDHCSALKLRVICPHDILVGGVHVRYVAYLPDFGSKSGALIDEIREPDFRISSTHRQIANDRSIFISFVNARSIQSRSDFIDMLRDWGYFGAEPPPISIFGKNTM